MTELLVLLTFLTLLGVVYLINQSKPIVSSSRKQAVFVDTSSLMDGRIVTAAQTGFLPSKLIVPRSVIHELQLLADMADPEKRSRARRGLDAVQEMQAMRHMQVETIDDGELDKGGVDDRLIDLAKRHDGSICTIDFNLNKAATALGIRILNINELAGSIRMAFLPGETISMALTQKGQSSSQAVGYLADGTMVVVDKASAKIGQTVEIEFIRSLQTAAGRMMFAKLVGNAAPVAAASDSSQDTARKVKSFGRKKPVPIKPGDTTESSAATIAQSAKTAETPRTSRRRQSKPRGREDSLIELVNKQTD